MKRSLRMPSENDWGLRKKRTESLLEGSGKAVGTFICSYILSESADRIRDNFIRTIEQKSYKEELGTILREQSKHQKELRDIGMLITYTKELYPNSRPHQDNLIKKDIAYLLTTDLAFYQKPLKNKKSLVVDCPYRYCEYVIEETGEGRQQSIKCIIEPNPYYQELRL